MMSVLNACYSLVFLSTTWELKTAFLNIFTLAGVSKSSVYSDLKRHLCVNGRSKYTEKALSTETPMHVWTRWYCRNTFMKNSRKAGSSQQTHPFRETQILAKGKQPNRAAWIDWQSVSGNGLAKYLQGWWRRVETGEGVGRVGQVPARLTKEVRTGVMLVRWSGEEV